MAEHCRSCDNRIEGEARKVDFSVLIPTDGDYDRAITVPANFMLCAACGEKFSQAQNFGKYRMMQAMLGQGDATQE